MPLAVPEYLFRTRKSQVGGVAWLPDSKAIIYGAAEPGHERRSYLLDLETGQSRPITREDTLGFLVTPDGKSLIAVDNQRQRWVYPIAGGEPQKFSPNVTFDEGVRMFLPDQKSVLAMKYDVPVRVTRAAGRREPWMEIVPADPAGAQSIPDVRFSADGKPYAYSVVRLLYAPALFKPRQSFRSHLDRRRFGRG